MEKNDARLGKFLFGLTPVVPIRQHWNKCASMGCHHGKLPGHDFCLSCLADDAFRPLVKRTCDNLTAVSETGEPL